MDMCDKNTTTIKMLPVCEECGYVFRDTLKWTAPGPNFSPNICPNCKRPITTLRVPDINYSMSQRGFVDLCDY